eukprot:7842000-Lingulodinium_polyedra.AAC.1
MPLNGRPQTLEIETPGENITRCWNAESPIFHQLVPQARNAWAARRSPMLATFMPTKNEWRTHRLARNT